MCGDRWGLLKVDEGALGFAATGIVASLAAPLSEARISIFYLSTYALVHQYPSRDVPLAHYALPLPASYLTDFLMIRSLDMRLATTTLVAKGFNVSEAT